MKNVIEFNHNYTKLHGQKAGFLCWANIYHMGKNFPQETYEYDTDGVYEFQKDVDYIQLVFLGDKEIPFTTYRRDKPKTREKYMKHVGEMFELKINSDQD